MGNTYRPHCDHWNVTPLENSKKKASPSPENEM